jgi:hypothetical protein
VTRPEAFLKNLARLRAFPHQRGRPKALEKMPPDERDVWKKLWKDVDSLLARTQEKKQRTQDHFRVHAASSTGKQVGSPRRFLVCKAFICYAEVTLVFGRSGGWL